MPGFEPIIPGAWRQPASATVTRGLLVPDFDAPMVAEEPGPDPALLEAEARAAALLEAERQGFAAGEAAGRAAASAAREQVVAESLARIAARLEALQDEARRVSEATAAECATALARLLLAALDAALPEAAARLAPESVVAFAESLRPILDQVPRLSLAVAPGLAAACAARIGDARVEVTEDPGLAPGDARAAWRGGGATLSLAARRQAVAALLAGYGLTESE